MRARARVRKPVRSETADSVSKSWGPIEGHNGLASPGAGLRRSRKRAETLGLRQLLQPFLGGGHFGVDRRLDPSRGCGRVGGLLAAVAGRDVVHIHDRDDEDFRASAQRLARRGRRSTDSRQARGPPSSSRSPTRAGGPESRSPAELGGRSGAFSSASLMCGSRAHRRPPRVRARSNSRSGERPGFLRPLDPARPCRAEGEGVAPTRPTMGRRRPRPHIASGRPTRPAGLGLPPVPAFVRGAAHVPGHRPARRQRACRCSSPGSIPGGRCRPGPASAASPRSARPPAATTSKASLRLRVAPRHEPNDATRLVDRFHTPESPLKSVLTRRSALAARADPEISGWPTTRPRMT